jgi:selenocysteine lyase/cysteine desulfurase
MAETERVTAATSDQGSDQAILAAARAEFEPQVVYLNTASMGLPPRRALAAIQRELRRWQHGRSSPPDFDPVVASARNSFATLVGVDPGRVAVGPQASVFAGLVAASLPDGAEVLTAEGEFTSLLFPFLAQVPRGIRVREVPLQHLAEEVTARTTLVAVAAVQSRDGRLADLDALTAICAATGTRVLLDITQAAGWLPIDADRFTYTVCAGYKWLLAPRGTCFFTVRPEASDALTPHFAGWYAAESPWDGIYGGPLRLAADARRFDISPAWHSWVGQAAALELLREVGAARLHRHAVGLANRFRAAIGAPPGESAIVSLSTDTDVEALLARTGIAASIRDGRLRLAFHINNDHEDVDRAAEALASHVRL